MGIEAVYSTYAPSEERYVKRLAAKYGLLVTGGSDFHGTNKKDIDLGNGRGHLFVPEELLDKIKAAYLNRYVPYEKNAKSVLFFDLDGTLLNDEKTISPRTKKALEACVAKGHVFVISSGRAYSSIIQVVERLGLDKCSPIISSFNGSQIYDLEKKEMLHSVKLSVDLVAQIRDLAKEMGVHIQSYSDTKVLTEHDNETVKFYCSYSKNEYEVLPDIAAKGFETYKLLAADIYNRPLLETLRSRIEENFGDRVQCCFSNQWFLEILPYGISKGTALKFVCDYMGVDIKHSYAFADAENDLPMLETAAYPTVLLNGIPKAKASARFITFTDNNNEGLAPFLEKLAEL